MITGANSSGLFPLASSSLFSPFLGFHTLAGLAIAFLFGLNRVAILLGVWTNNPWWIVPYYVMATWAGMWVTGFWVDWATLKEVFQSERLRIHDLGFWTQIASQWGFLLSFGIGSFILCTLFSFIAYPPLSKNGLSFTGHIRKQKAKSRGQGV